MKRIHLLLPILLAIIHIACKKSKEVEEAFTQTELNNTPDSPTEGKPYLVVADSIGTIKATSIKMAYNAMPGLSALAKKATHDVKLYKVQYKTHYQGKEVIASGVIGIPVTKAITWPTLSLHHGTIFSENEAPTKRGEEQLSIAGMASAGYIVVAPDYLGFGSSFGITHPYYVAKYSASVTKDMLRAAKELVMKEGAAYNGKLFLAGYSQGGNVTVATAKSLEESPIEGFTLIASAAGAGGYNLQGIFKTINSLDIFPSPNYLAYVVQAFRTANQWSTPLSYYFREPYASRIPNLINGKTESSVVNSNLTVVFDSLMQPGFVSGLEKGTETTFLKALAENSLHEWKPTKPLRFYHGDADEVVPYSDTESTFKHMKDLGSPSVSFVPLPGKSHGTGVVPMLINVMDWFESIK